jgi:glycosyltransferase involved in cell wall biosynthesis
MTPVRPYVSIICPAFNEEAGIGDAIATLRGLLDELAVPAEVLIVNDGSVDRTVAVAARAIGADPRFRILSHRANFGRGRAMKTGFAEAAGEVIVTTEADLSWGRDVVGAMLDLLDQDPRLDAVFASPHVQGGGYRNVPGHRVALSRWGNRILRALYPSDISMTTGMTRAYRAWVIQGQRFANDGKELHLEIAHRLMSLGHRIGEVPAVLSWPDDRDDQQSRGQRTDWRKIRKLIASHLAFGVFQGISRIIVPAIVFLTVAIVVFGVWAVRNALVHQVSIFLVMVTGLLVSLWINLTVAYFLLSHVFHIETDIWRLDQSIAGAREAAVPPLHRRYYFEEPPAPAETTSA